MILMGYLNTRLGYPRDKHEEDLVTALADRGLVNTTNHLLPKRRYGGAGICTWSIQRDRQRVTGRGDYILSKERISFVNTGLRET